QDQPLLELGLGQSCPAAQREKPLLGLAFGRCGPDVVLLEHGGHLARRVPGRIAGELVLDRFEIEYFADLRLVEGVLEAAAFDDVGEVHEGAGDRGAGDVVDGRGVGVSQRRRAMESMPGRARRVRPGTVTSTWARLQSRSPCRAAALRWLRTAPGPAASTAAIQWPSRLSSVAGVSE